MSGPKPDVLDLAVRVYPVIAKPEPHSDNSKKWRRPEAMVVLDTETRVDETQRLTFGSYRFFQDGLCAGEYLFHADDLPDRDRAVLEQYVMTHEADTIDERNSKLSLLSRTEFAKRFFNNVYRSRCLLVGFNLPFDLSRVAINSGNARGRYAGGFSLGLWSYRGGDGVERSSTRRPRICIKHIDSRRAIKAFTSRYEPDSDDLIPEESEDGAPDDKFIFRGHFLDLRTLASALTDQSYSLEAACKAFEVENGKQKVSAHGIVTEEYIDYNRRDVLATAELAEKLLAEFAKHQIELQPTKAYSPASIGKAYLRQMGIKPIVERQPDFPKEFLGYAESAFFGGRASAHVRKVTVPVVYTDFLSMYPTVNSLMDLWSFVIAEEIRVVQDCQEDILRLLKRISLEKLFDPATWKSLTAFVKIIPDGDILPNRAKYNQDSNDWQVAVNYLYASDHEANREIWVSLPDVVASVILTGKIPNIVGAFRIKPHGIQAGLLKTKLYSQVEIDPAQDDFFKRVIEERKRSSSRADLVPEERERLDKALKVLANSASYGIYAEMHRKESDQKIDVTCHGVDRESFSCSVAHPDQVGEFCFPPLASLITGAARLMLALLERCVSDLRGTYAMEDTDSMGIVATKRGGLIECASGPFRTQAGKAAVKALTWEQVKEISQRFEALKPYDRKMVPDAVLKIEEDNFYEGKQRQLYCFAISAKRYARFTLNKTSEPFLLRRGSNNKIDRWSRHGLGHLLNPTDPDSDGQDWIGQIWLNMIRKALGHQIEKLAFANRPAVGRTRISSPSVMRSLKQFNAGKRYPDQIKPFNFLLTCHVKPFGHPTGTDPERFQLIAPFESDSRKWLRTYWIDKYSQARYHITTTGHHGDRRTARVKTYGDVVRDYEFHPESKCADADGNACDRQTVGLLARRHVRVDCLRTIGKESNFLEEVEEGLIHSGEDVYTEYPNPKNDEWNLKILPVLKAVPLAVLIKETGLSRRALLDLRAGRSRPHPKNRRLIVDALRRLGLNLMGVGRSLRRFPD